MVLLHCTAGVGAGLVRDTDGGGVRQIKKKINYMQNNPLLHITSINVQTKVGYLWLPSQVTHHRPLAALSTQPTVQAWEAELKSQGRIHDFK